MRQVVFWLHARLSNISKRLARLRHARAGASGPRPGDPAMPLVLLIPSRWARVRDDLAEVVEEADGGTTSAELEVGAAQRRPVLHVAAEVGGRTRHVVAEPPHTAALGLLVLDTVLERAEEGVEGCWRALVRGRE